MARGSSDPLEGRKWDAVFDDSATNPDWLRQSAALLKGNVAQYSFTSSTGVYYPYLKKGLDESTPPLLEGDQKDGSAALGTAKAQCEKIVLDTFGETLAWWPTVPEARRDAPRFALSPEQEATVLAAWKAKKG